MAGFELLVHLLKAPFEWYELKKQARELEHLLRTEDIAAFKSEAKNVIERKYPHELSTSTYKV